MLIKRHEIIVTGRAAPPDKVVVDFPRVVAAKREIAARARATGNGGLSFVALNISGEISEKTAVAVKKALAEAPHARTIRLTIDSIGGSFVDALAIYSAIARHPAERKSARVTHHCASAAVMALLSCDHREAAADAKLMIHRAEIEPGRDGDRWTARKHSLAGASLKLADERMVSIITTRTIASRQDIIAEMKTESDMPLLTALQWGVLHEVDNLSQPCRADWPGNLKMAARRGTMFGLPAWMFTDNYLAACQATIRR